MTVKRIATLKQLIHIGKKQLGLDDDTYRALLSNTIKGKDSCSVMSLGELERVLTAMQKQGFKVSGGAKQRPLAKDGQSRKMRALWLDMHGLGYVENASEAALAAFAKRVTGVSALQWLNVKQASKVIEALKAMAARDEKKIEQLLQMLVHQRVLPPSALDIPQYCHQVTGHPVGSDMTKAVAQQLLAHLEELANVDHTKAG